MNASTSPHGFTTVRGRGYRPEQVDRRVDALFRDRDDAWERAARLTVLAKQMEAEAAALRERVAQLPPQTYESLGERAQTILALSRESADELRTQAEDEAAELRATAVAEGSAVREAARAAAERVRAQAEETASRLLAEAATAADGVRTAARRDAEEWGAEAQAALKETRKRSEGIRTDQEQEHAARWEAAERAVAEREAEADERFAALTSRAEAVLAAARKDLAEAEEEARHGQEDAEARAAELVAEARGVEARIERETERVLREHDEAREEVQAHMAHVRNSLATLTGRATTEG
ncbi:cellulose-binding protein [Streptomyces cremeus]|uniref:Cellulose-binding protein n=1 Tax=Streptomyces cremeus TaxID=66881 RepID=A0ABV5PA60_STRCM